jgi:hypothetical protein
MNSTAEAGTDPQYRVAGLDEPWQRLPFRGLDFTPILA